jgi:tetratricopeptide (TPR) repeat protein
MNSDHDRAASDFLDLLKAFPDYRPARLFYAEWHYNTGNHRAALKGYERAFRLGAASARHYHKAAHAASKLGLNERALQILQDAAKQLPAGEMTGVMLYNMGCYHARLGNLDAAMDHLHKAVRVGGVKRELYLTDVDLDPLRGRNDFKRLLAAL